MTLVAENEWHPIVAVQGLFNVVQRDAHQRDKQELCATHEIACLPYFALANGFLTGRYRPGSKLGGHRVRCAANFLTPSGFALIDVLDGIARQHRTTVPTVALAWLRHQPAVAVPVAGATRVNQLEQLLEFIPLTLDDEDLDAIDKANDFLQLANASSSELR